MFTDMVGYSALAQRDDKVALELLEEHRRLLREIFRQFRNALEARFEKFGSADLKNIKLRMDLFRIILPWEKGAESPSKRTSKKSPLLVPAAILVILALLAGWWWMQL